MSKILFISTRYPFPIFGGDKLRLFSIIKYLSKKNHVDLVCLGKKNEPQKNLSFCRKINVFRLNFLNRIINTIFSFLKLEPLQNGFCLSKEMKEYITNVEHKYDTIICHLLRSSQYLPAKFKGKRILEITDLPSSNYEQLIDQLSIFNPIKYIYILEKFLVYRYETKVSDKFHKIVFVSHKDAAKAKKKIPKKKILVVESAENFTSKVFKYKKNNNKIIFIGNINYIPNKLACYYFAKNILKKINLNYPEIKFHIIGNIGNVDRFFLGRYKNVVVHGKVNNLKNVVKNSICGLCNVKVSTGFQFKTLTYMSYGIPSILSLNSFVNTKFKKNSEVLVFKNDEDLIKNICYLKNSKTKANQLSINSQKTIKKKYNINKILLKYSKII
ncbi:MAG: glycosyltransferase [Candidatus Pelagibacterales bacterium]|nr:MAG: glycosyltransferase [Pelagibacterales bacterium]